MNVYRNVKQFFRPLKQRPQVDHQWIMLRPIELGHLVILVIILIIYSTMVSSINFKVDSVSIDIQKDGFENVKYKDIKNKKKIIEKFGTPSPGYLSFFKPTDELFEIYTNVVGFLFGITLSSYFKTVVLEGSSSSNVAAPLVLLVIVVGGIYLYYKVDVTIGEDSNQKRLSIFMYPLLGGLTLLGESVIIHIGDAMGRKINEERGELIMKNKAINAARAVKKLFPLLQINDSKPDEPELIKSWEEYQLFNNDQIREALANPGNYPGFAELHRNVIGVVPPPEVEGVLNIREPDPFEPQGFAQGRIEVAEDAGPFQNLPGAVHREFVAWPEG